MNTLRFFFVVLLVAGIAESNSVEQTNSVDKKDQISEENSRKERQVSFPVYFDAPSQGLLSNLGLGNTNLPIVGTLLGSQPNGLIGGLGQQVGGLTSGLLGPSNGGPLGGLSSTVGGLTNGLSGLTGNVGNLGGLVNLVGLTSQQGNSGSCPLAQKLTCRCEPLLGLREPTKDDNILQVNQQSLIHHKDGSQELRASLSNGMKLYQKSSFENLTTNQNGLLREGYISMKLFNEQFFNIYYTVNALNYEVRADVTTASPLA